MYIIKKGLIIISFIFVSIFFMSCTSNKDEVFNEDINNSIKIGVFIYRFDDQFISSLMEVIESEVEKLNEIDPQKFELTIFDGKNQQDIQTDQIEQLIKEDYDVLAINLVDRSNASDIINKAKEADIPIVFFNRMPVQVDMARWDKIYYVGSKAEESGLIVGEIAGEYWLNHPKADKNGDGIMQYVLLEGQPGHQDAILRTEFSVKALKDMGISLEELVRDTGNWQRAEGKDLMMDWLDFFGEKIEVVLSNNDSMGLGAIDAMKEKGIKLIPVVGVDGIDLAKEALEKGEIIGTVLNDNVGQGKMIIQIAYYLAFGLDPSHYIEGIEDGTYYWVPYQKIIK